MDTTTLDGGRTERTGPGDGDGHLWSVGLALRVVAHAASERAGGDG